jgi:hypothetical protein
MRQQRIRNYNWTPQQMARVNAQRNARGQEELLNSKMENPEYSDEYENYYNEVQKKSKQPVGIAKSKYDLEKEAASKIPLSQRIKESDVSFEEKFRKKQMLPKEIGGMKRGISSPSTRQGYPMVA